MAHTAGFDEGRARAVGLSKGSRGAGTMRGTVLRILAVAAVAGAVGMAWRVFVGPGPAGGSSGRPAVERVLDGLGERGTPGERAAAAAEVRRSAALRADARVRAALIEALARANAESSAARERAGPEHGEAEGEMHVALLEAVGALDDARAIPALIGAVDTGNATRSALARYGGQALDQMLAAWRARPADGSRGRFAWRGGLLRAMAEVAAGGLNDDRRAEVVAVAREALEQPGDALVLAGAMRLAVTLREPALVAQVESLARDPGELSRRGVDPRLVDFMTRSARDLLGRPEAPGPAAPKADVGAPAATPGVEREGRGGAGEPKVGGR